MSGHRRVLNIHVVFFAMWFLHVCISKTLSNNRQKRYTEDDACHESKTTVKKVQVCPVNVEAFKKRSTEKNCSMYQQCAGHPLVYHCVRNGGRLVEVCTPRTLITGNVCPYYEMRLGRVIDDYKKICIQCPFQYHSDICYMFSECVTTSVTNEDSTDQTSSGEKTDSNLHVYVMVTPDYTDYSFTSKPGDNTTKQDGEKQDDSIVFYIIMSVVGISVWGIIAAFLIIRDCLTHRDGPKKIINE